MWKGVGSRENNVWMLLGITLVQRVLPCHHFKSWRLPLICCCRLLSSWVEVLAQTSIAFFFHFQKRTSTCPKPDVRAQACPLSQPFQKRSSSPMWYHTITLTCVLWWQGEAEQCMLCVAPKRPPLMPTDKQNNKSLPSLVQEKFLWNP